MRFFWPTAKPEVGAVGRLGRVLHWTGSGFAVLWAIAAIGNLVSAILGFQNNDGYGWALICALAAVLGYLFARGVRYVLAGE